ncbi:MAG TPA: (d)CMP kinase [Acidobacteriaceae bacterium]|nr:(d)CMP kinase [Acidobacteriaceae bacterium]
MTSSADGRLRPVIAIDGPAGAGKSTLAAHLARRFGLLNLETGAMYRALALKALETTTALGDEAALARLTESTQIALESRPNEGNRVLLDGKDVTARIREKDVSEAASQVSVHPRVRAWMVERQRAMGRQGGVVMEGRDIGTKVFPDAELKIFLDAQDEIRGQRRYLQSAGSTNAPTAEAVLAAVRDRDARDRNRATSPLEPAADAIHLDTTGLTLEQVYALAEDLVRAKIPG